MIGMMRFRARFVLFFAAGILLLLDGWTGILGLLGRPTVWDDAFMYVRYADHYRAGFGMAWNPGEGGTFGLTSLLFFVVALASRAVFPDLEPVSAAPLASSLISGIAAVLLMLLLVRRAGGVDRRLRACRVLVVLGALSATNHAEVRSQLTGLAPHLLTGMDTTFAMAWVAFCLLVFRRLGLQSGPRPAIGMGVLSGLTFLARPDLLLILGPALLGVVRGGRGAADLALDVGRRGLVAAGTLVLVLCMVRWRLGSWLPLPFYAKGQALYGADIYQIYEGVAVRELSLFLGNYWFLLAPPMLCMALRTVAWWRRSAPWEVGLIAGCILFAAYHATMVLPIMHFHQRFLMPLLPALVYLCARSLGPLLGGWRHPAGGRRRWLEFVVVGAIIAGPILHLPEIVGELRSAGPRLATLHDIDDPDGRFAPAFRVLRTLHALPDDLVIASSEVGLVGLYGRFKRVIDLAGLHDPRHVRGGFSADRLLREDCPDFLMLPHPDYRSIAVEIINHPVYRADYELYDRMKTKFWNVALLRSSPYYPRLRAVMEGLAR
jgi:hypothetical protein